MLHRNPKLSLLDENISVTIKKVESVFNGLIVPSETMPLDSDLNCAQDKSLFFKKFKQNFGALKANVNLGFDSWFVNRAEIGISLASPKLLLQDNEKYMKWYGTAKQLLSAKDIEQQKDILLGHFGPGNYYLIESNLQPKTMRNVIPFFAPPPPAPIHNQIAEKDAVQLLVEILAELPPNIECATTIDIKKDFAEKIRLPVFSELREQLGILTFTGSTDTKFTTMVIDKILYRKRYERFLLDEGIFLNRELFKVKLTESQIKEKQVLLNNSPSTPQHKRKNSSEYEQQSKHPRTVDSDVQEQVDLFAGLTDLAGLDLFNVNETTDAKAIIAAIEQTLEIDQQNEQSSFQQFGLK